ncbi:hypothetical protein H0H93_014741 [Arthromyces matolae]|nr:hypothetical protein H0H93_014741 [Arthromyces matolae]
MRASATQANQNISSAYAPGGMLDSQQDSQAWLENLDGSPELIDTKNPSVSFPLPTEVAPPSPPQNLQDSSDIEVVEEKISSKKRRRTAAVEEDTATTLHRHVDLLNSAFQTACAERKKLHDELAYANFELETVRTRLEEVMVLLQEAQLDNDHLRKVVISCGKKLIDHGPGKVKCLCTFKVK